MLHISNGLLTSESVALLRKHSLSKDANPVHKIAEGMAFADVVQEIPLPALIQVVGLRVNISKVAAITIVHFHCSPN
jgi:hypothetical protein